MKFQKNNEVKAKGSGRFIAFIKRHKVPLGIITGSIIAVVVVIFIAASAVLKARTAKIKNGLEGKFFITNTDDNSEYGIQLFAFKDGMIAEENWKNGKLTGDISSYKQEYMVVTELFDSSAYIKHSYRDDWQPTGIRVSFDNDGNLTMYYRGILSCHGITSEEIEKERKLYICIEHTFGDPIVISEATCSREGAEKLVCTNCGYEKITRKTLPHNYVNGICTECGAQNLTVKSDIEADTWYVYNPLDLLKFQNCVVVNASSAGSKAIIAQYFSVCKECHMIELNGEGLPRAAAPELNYPIQKMYHCGKCGETTIVRLEIIQ